MFAVRNCVVLLCLAVLPLVVFAQGVPSPGAVVVEKENVVEAQPRGLAWKPASLGLPLAVRDRLRTGEFSRAAVRFTDLSMLRVDELTTIEISPPVTLGGKQTLDVKRGGTYFFSRDKAESIEIRTPAANGALRGTEFELRVAANGRTRLTMFDGEVELGNAHGSVRLTSGEQAEVEVGRAPRKTAVIEAVNIIQWCLYYPAVLDPEELGLAASGSRALEAYRAGNLLEALETDAGKGAVRTTADRLFRASLILSVGQVDKARAALKGVPTSDSRRQAIEQMIAAVKLQPWPRAAEPRTGSEWLAESYYLQSRSDLAGALRAAKKATELSPNFGYAWARVAELEFSFGRIPKSMKVLERALELSPRNAQAYALQGFLLAGENRIGAARRSFDAAIELDGALGNAWLGRGLTFIRQNREEEGQRDLQTAAVLEPNRSILRSYLGKAFSQVGVNGKANLEFERAKELDPKDPTPWLYSAIQRKQENRYNEAVDDLEKAVELNDNRRVYRSRFLLDQDSAVRGANLASIYQNNGMVEQSVREAVRAVNTDYGSAPAHLFLANSYDALRDPARFVLRYETAWFNELLLANLLSPVGGGPLSQFVSQQEYSKLFAKDGLGISSLTEFQGDGRFRETASQFGTSGNVSYALDAEYYYDNGRWPNSKVSRFEGFATFKLQLTPQDTVFFQAKYQDQSSGYAFQQYDPSVVGRETSVEVPTEDGGLTKRVTKNVPALSYTANEMQEPGLLLAGWRHEWSPGNTSLLLLSRLASDYTLTTDDVAVPFVSRRLTERVPADLFTDLSEGRIARDRDYFNYLKRFTGWPEPSIVTSRVFDVDYRNNFEIYGAEFQQILTFGPQSVLFGGRYQAGEFETQARLSDFANDPLSLEASNLQYPVIDQRTNREFERLSLYLYSNLHLTRWLTLSGGLSYDRLKYPSNFSNVPIDDREAWLRGVNPKVGLTLTPWRGATLRGAYMESMSGTSFDESIRLEPVQVAGFLQSYRSVLSESVVGTVAGNKYKLAGASFEQKLPTRTYLGLEFNVLMQDMDRRIGAIDSFDTFGDVLGNLPSSLNEKDSYREDIITASVNQLITDRWSFGATYRYTHAQFRQQLTGLSDALSRGLKNDFTVSFNGDRLQGLARAVDRTSETNLHHLNLHLLLNHPTGFFARGDADLYVQDNDQFGLSVVDLPVPGDTAEPDPRLRTQNLGLPGDEFWQFNFQAGYQFYRNQFEVSAGVLNIANEDYRLNPLVPYLDLPRERTFFVRCRLNF